MKLSSFDAAKILGYVVAALSGITSQGLEAAGLPDHTAAHVTGIISIVTLSATLVVNAIKNQSAPAGTTRAVIPVGSIPVVAAAPGTGVASVARADPSVVLEVTNADARPVHGYAVTPAPDVAPKSDNPITAISQAIEKRANAAPLPITVVSDVAFRTRLRALQAARAQLGHVATPAGATVGASVKEP